MTLSEGTFLCLGDFTGSVAAAGGAESTCGSEEQASSKLDELGQRLRHLLQLHLPHLVQLHQVLHQLLDLCLRRAR